MYIYIYYILKYTKKLSITFLWVSKFDVKLGGYPVPNTKFKITLCKCFKSELRVKKKGHLPMVILKFVTITPTKNQILKPIRMFVTIFEYIYK